jgi:hypothetical protein
LRGGKTAIEIDRLLPEMENGRSGRVGARVAATNATTSLLGGTSETLC